MSRSLERLTAEAAAARSAEEQLRAGAVAVELDPALIDPSPAPDRLPVVDTRSEASFNEIIRVQGQQTPILVRPHPAVSGRYQVAFGHRRLRAAAALGRPVRALVKTLTDAELVVAQGQENNARQDLSFIERAAFAHTLERLGHGRDVIMAALVVDKTELSRLIAVRRAVPDFIVEAVGPAPKAGRRRWMSLADRLTGPDMQTLAEGIVSDVTFRTLSSDARFLRIFQAIGPQELSASTSADVRTVADLHHFVKVDRNERTLALLIDGTDHPEFGDYLLNRLPELFQSFQQAQSRKRNPSA
jgi:ParB family chromosome partitioning protein